MNKRCKRCGKIEVIPQKHVLKFDDKEKPICNRCWESYQRWFNLNRKEGK
jgi:NAD-dependent dihydropyrimidine dehydrogenase PreA subunit